MPSRNKEATSASDPDSVVQTRRQVLGTVGGTGLLGVTGVGGSIASDDKVEIVTHRSANGPEKTKKVPRSWAQNYNNTLRAKRNLEQRFRDRDGYSGAAITASDQFFGGKRGFGVDLFISSSATLRGNVPDTSNGIPVHVSDPIKPKLAGCFTQDACHNESVFDSTPGGVTFDGATSSSIFYIDKSGDGYYTDSMMLTAAHIIDPSHCDTETFDYSSTITQHCETWGEPYWASPRRDVVLCEATASGKSVDNHIQDASGNSYPVTGHVTESGIADMISTGETAHKTGIMTGDTSGPILRMNLGDSTNCHDWNLEGVEVDVYGTSGDSGGPIYDIDGNDAYMISVFSTTGSGSPGITDCTGQEYNYYCYGTAAYELVDYFNGSFVYAPV